MNMQIRSLLFAALCLTLTAPAADAATKAPPAFPASVTQKAPTAPKTTAGVLTVLNNPVDLLRSGKRYAVSESLSLAKGDVLRVPENTKLRFVLRGGDVVNLSGPATLKIDTALSLFKGEAVAYVLPRLGGRKTPFTIMTPLGDLSLSAGKVMLSASESGVTASVLENRALWREKDGASRKIAKGDAISVAGTKTEKLRIAIAQAERQAALSGPDTTLFKEGVEAYGAGDKAKAERIFTALQAAYPYNPGAAYYLGQIMLEDGRRSDAIEQWQAFQKIDPTGAKKKHVPEHLTALISEEMDAQMKLALLAEEKLGSQAPEPNSVAVSPFTNKSDARYKMLSKGIAALLIADLAKVPGVKVLERQKIQKILDEIALSESGLVDDSSAVRAGKIMKAEKIVIGDFEIDE